MQVKPQRTQGPYEHICCYECRKLNDCSHPLIPSKHTGALPLRYCTKHVNLIDKPRHKVQWGKMFIRKEKQRMLRRHQEEGKQLISEWPKFRDNCEPSIEERSNEGQSRSLCGSYTWGLAPDTLSLNIDMRKQNRALEQPRSLVSRIWVCVNLWTSLSFTLYAIKNTQRLKCKL